MSNAKIVLHLGIAGGFREFGDMTEGEQKTVKRVHEMRDISVAIGSETPCGAIAFSRSGGASYAAAGNVDSHAALTALQDARFGGVGSNITLAVSVPDNRAPGALPQDVLDALGEFGTTMVLLIGDDRSVVVATVSEAEVAA